MKHVLDKTFPTRPEALEKAKAIRNQGYRAKVQKLAARPTKNQKIKYVVYYWT